ncbi:MAG: DegQ family serine endoprotease [Gammaproteobacteria bacterium]|nr:DegQ family serine endoprotease [Gammaproteobacteria bacterium]
MLASCAQPAGEAKSPATTAGTTAGASREAPPPLLVDPSGLPDFSRLVEAYGGAVVNVSTVQGASDTGEEGMSPDDPMHDFFKRFGFGEGMPRQHPPTRGEGSGFIISSDGYILTNAHVVDQASEVTVRFTDRREFRAKIVGSDERTDVAVLKVEAKDLPTVRFGDPEALKAGEWVVAIGSPFGFDNSVTAGIVSAKARSLPGDGYTPFIQTDVAVNPGNSGGPLFNLRGEVVGINSQIYSRTGGYQGVSFAIPIDVAVSVKDQLVKTGKVSRGKIGVTIQEVNQSLADSFGLDRPRGALVSSVEKGGPAAKAGIEAGDVIVAADGRNVERSSDLPSIIARIAPGTTTKLEVWRDRKAMSIAVKVGALEEQKTSRAVPARGEEAGRLGLAVRPLTQKERSEAGTDGQLLVEDVSGPAAAAGVMPGDIILRVNGRAVSTPDQLRTAAAGGGAVALLVQRGDAQIYLPVRMGQG